MRSNTRPNLTPAEEMGLGPKKTILVLCTVIGCIAILTPKIFYPMVMGPSPPKQGDNRVPIDLQKQERPSHIRDALHPSMLERGKAIQHPHAIPIVERPGRGLPPRTANIERRPGAPSVPGQPGPNMRAAGYQVQQQQKTAGQTSIIMPIYTFAIVAFFIFTIVKIVMKKTNRNVEKPLESDPIFCEKVFKQPDEKKSKLVYTAIQGIIDATNEQLKEIEKDCAENNKEHPSSKTEEEIADVPIVSEPEQETEPASEDIIELSDKEETHEETLEEKPQSEQQFEVDRRLSHLREALHIKSVENDANSDLKSIFLDGELPQDPQILVSATETETTDYSSTGGKDMDDDDAIILSAKCTISLISLNNDEKNGLVEDHTTTTTNNVA